MLYGELLWIIMAYFLGSVPFGLLIAKYGCNIDPRKAGSNSIGATNISRLCGIQYGILTLICDVAKGTLPVWGVMFFTDNELVISLTALAAVTGHIYSCFLGFKGGKAVATSIGVYIPIAFWPLLGACALGMLVIWRTKFVSMGSMTIMGSLPFILAFCGMWEWIPLSVCLCVIVFIKHKDNIQRLRNGTENPWIKPKTDENIK